MTDYIRRLVSGNKARFRDGNLNVELDLVYITDQVIIMGYPAQGFEGFYRNRREDAKKFLEHRHGKNFWVFNFCPIKENSYASSFFDNRVSRYPFPDHHAPPLAILPLVAREMHLWLDGSKDRVAVLHCKAGKGRSGTLACTYLLSLGDNISPPRLERSYNAKQWAKIRADEMMQVIPNVDADKDDPHQSHTPPPESSGVLEEGPLNEESAPILPASTPPSSASVTSVDSLKNVLDLHTQRRMKASGDKVKQGVSIPSQRRWLYYWSLLLAGGAPPHFWTLADPAPVRPKVRLTQIRVRMKETSRMRVKLVKAANLVIERTNMVKNLEGSRQGRIWVSLARYDDDMVDLLESWERYTRDEQNMGRRKRGTDHMNDDAIAQLFTDGKWDKGKMVRSFARMGAKEDAPVLTEESEKDGPVHTYTLRPLSDASWVSIRDEIKEEDHPAPAKESPISAANSIFDVTQTVKGETGVVLDAGRETRIKLYMGQVPMGWLWFIPTFHMASTPDSLSGGPTKFVLTRKELDFPLGVGSGIVDVEISLDWLPAADAAEVQPPARQSSAESREEGSNEPSGLAATVQAVMAQEPGGAVEAKQAAED